MRWKVKPYTVLRLLCYASAAAITYAVWAIVPVVRHPSPWYPVFWFALFATLAELLTVSLDEVGTFGNILGAAITPTSPIAWAATAVLGPMPAIVVCVVSGVLADCIPCASFHIIQHLDRRPKHKEAPPEGEARLSTEALSRWMVGRLRVSGANWEPKVGFPFLYSIQMNAQYVSGLILTAGASGLVYYRLGGWFLIQGGLEGNLVRHFVLPFLGLVLAGVAVEHLLHLLVVAALDPITGARGLYSVILRMKRSLIEDVLPVTRAQLFLVVVALLLAYLYAHIRVVGFVVAAMPVMALRDFFYQWVQEKNAYLNTITALATYMQLYHPYTRGHLKRVADISERLAVELKLPAESVRHIRPAGFLHDIGKIGVSEEILDKPGKLSAEEWEKIKEHPVKGAEIVSHIEFLEGIVEWIRYHHKWHDGSGYPSTNGNGAIPIEAAIIAVADSFDAMTDDRELASGWKCDSCGYQPENDERPSNCPACGAVKRRIYKEPKSLDQAVDELRRGAGSQFNPRVVKAFLTMVERDGIHVNA